MKITKEQGFTLIEMMVVIAVVGILSAAVLAGLGPSRKKARDARVISGLNQIRTFAEAEYDPFGTAPYKDLDSKVTSLKQDIAKQGTQASVDVHPNGFSYSASADLPSGAGKYCVDHTGATGIVISASNTGCGTPADPGGCTDGDTQVCQTTGLSTCSGGSWGTCVGGTSVSGGSGLDENASCNPADDQCGTGLTCQYVFLAAKNLCKP